jgi:hypothetical protein
MYVHWRERGHEEISALVGEDPNAISSLMQCGLLKFFLCPFMRAQPRILNAVVDYWHPNVEEFMLEGQSLMPTIEDIYFLTGLSRRGEPVNFHMFPSGLHNISELIELYYEAGTDKMSSQVPISKIFDLALQAIVLLIRQITGSAALHQASHAQMNCVVQCLNAHIFYWRTTLLDCMKRQLIDCHSRT